MDELLPTPSRRMMLGALVSGAAGALSSNQGMPSILQNDHDDKLPLLQRTRAGRHLSRIRYHNAERFFATLHDGASMHTNDLLYRPGIVVQLALSAHLLDVGFRVALQQRLSRHGTCRYRIYGAPSQALVRDRLCAATGKISCFSYPWSVSFLHRLRGFPLAFSQSPTRCVAVQVHALAMLSRCTLAAFQSATFCSVQSTAACDALVHDLPSLKLVSLLASRRRGVGRSLPAESGSAQYMNRYIFLGTCAALLSAGTLRAAEAIVYKYDARGRVIEVKRAGTVNNNVQTNYTHDKANNRKTVTTTGSANTPSP